ncbi:MAG: universal stress protein [Syntrophales bacterium]|nr:universal stress protein [Syntrophales bacterium]
MIPKINRFLLASDLSENSNYAFRYAVDAAEKNNAEVVILHVIEELPANTLSYIRLTVPDEAIERMNSEVTGKMKARIEELVKLTLRKKPEALKRIRPIEVKKGRPVEEILKVADEQNCDIIIMGTHGKGFLTSPVLGTVAERVLRRSSKPVLVIPIKKV